IKTPSLSLHTDSISSHKESFEKSSIDSCCLGDSPETFNFHLHLPSPAHRNQTCSSTNLGQLTRRRTRAAALVTLRKANASYPKLW
ncbi:uncharacterized, partial [Tachysurus ichikawai]